MVRWVLAVLAIIFTGTAQADDVTLLSHDRSVEITGQILGFDGEFYRVGTPYGELTIDASGVTCDGPGCPNLTTFVPQITLVGAEPLAEILFPALIEGFALQSRMQVRRDDQDNGTLYRLLRPARGDVALRLLVQSGTTADGFKALLAGRADLALALRELRPEEKAAARQAGMGDLQETGQAIIVGLDAIVGAVAPGNPVKSISLAELAQVFAGVTTNWSDLGGENAPIRLHLPPVGSGLEEAIADRILSPDGLIMAEGQRHQRTNDIGMSVASDPFGIGLVAKSQLGSARALTLSSGCGHVLAASHQSLKTEDYPLTAPLFLYQPMRRLPKLGRDLVNYIQGADAQLVIRASGFTDQAPDLLLLGGQGERLANAILAAGPETSLADLQDMVALMRDVDRLSSTVRFLPNSPNPDAQSRGSISLLVRALERGAFDGRRLIFAGFSDGDGSADANRRIALRRAEIVRDTVIDAAETVETSKLTIETYGFGEALPMACDNSGWGRRVNRRVEIWMR